MRKLAVKAGVAAVLVFVVPLIGASLLRSVSPGEFVATFPTDSLDSTQWQVDTDASCRLELANHVRNTQSYAVRLEAQPGSRCELVPALFSPMLRKLLREPYGEVREYSFRVYFPKAPAQSVSPPPIDQNLIVAQWHSSPDPFPGGEPGRGPPLALRIHNGKWGITVGSEPQLRSPGGYVANQWYWLGPVAEGQWTEWNFHVRWSWRDNGYLAVRRDGQLLLEIDGPIAYNDLRGVYLKLGLYHPVEKQAMLIDDIVLRSIND